VDRLRHGPHLPRFAGKEYDEPVKRAAWRRRDFAALAALAPFGVACGGSIPQPTASPSPTPVPTPAGPALGPSGWIAQDSSLLSPGESRHDDLVFLDRSTGFLINTRAEVHATMDGGATWQMRAKLAQDQILRCAGFASPTLGWAGNINFTAGTARQNYSLFETTDGGSTWSNISDRIQGANLVGLCGMRVVDQNTIVGVGRWCGPALFLKSVDRGRTWTCRSLLPHATGIVDVFFFNPMQGFAIGGLGVGTSESDQRASRAVILATQDGGETWSARYTSAGLGQWCWKIHFVDDQVGYVTTEGPSPHGAVLKTTDGGATWTPMLVGAGIAFEGVGFVSRERGWVGSFPTMYQTADGGATWGRLGFGIRVNRMRVVAPDLVYAVGDRAYRWSA
jgi:photosystem II stability/assembly factor-like uncharacterized protein